jgi:hypothetical protein
VPKKEGGRGIRAAHELLVWYENVVVWALGCFENLTFLNFEGKIVLLFENQPFFSNY